MMMARRESGVRRFLKPHTYTSASYRQHLFPRLTSKIWLPAVGTAVVVLALLLEF